MKVKVLGLALFLVLTYFSSPVAQAKFSVNCERNQFELDGRPFRYIAGELHYFRIAHSLWRDRLQRLRALGLNTAQVYIAWNFHEEREGQFNFAGDRNVREFIQLAAELGLYVTLRIGPYICAEWEHGGLPWWLLAFDEVSLREKKNPYFYYAKRWLKRVADQIADLQYPDGPVLMVQVENEYGSFHHGPDHDYMDSLVEYVSGLGLNRSVLYTTDGGSAYYLEGGVAKGAYPTVDFGPAGSADAVKRSFDDQKRYAKCGPPVNSEFYPGWFTSWFQSRPRYSSIQSVIRTMQYMYDQGASFSFYVIHGGTNFGFWNGAELDSYIATTYDYGAPIDEAGQITEKYVAIWKWLGQLKGWDKKPMELPKNHTPIQVPELVARRLDLSLPEALLNLSRNCKQVRKPETFEKLGQAFGYALYSHELPRTFSELRVPFFRDLVYVFIGDQFQGLLGSCNISACAQTSLKLKPHDEGRLYLVVESLGRLNYNHGLDRKGIRSDVFLDDKVLTNWTECGVKVDKIPVLARKLAKQGRFASAGSAPAPGLYYARYELSTNLPAEDLFTYFDGRSLGKGQLWVNDVNVGRYWPAAGPLTTLYVPGVFLRLGPRQTAGNGATDRHSDLRNWEDVYARVAEQAYEEAVDELSHHSSNQVRRAHSIRPPHNEWVLLNFEPRGAAVQFDLVAQHRWNRPTQPSVRTGHAAL